MAGVGFASASSTDLYSEKGCRCFSLVFSQQRRSSVQPKYSICHARLQYELFPIVRACCEREISNRGADGPHITTIVIDRLESAGLLEYSAQYAGQWNWQHDWFDHGCIDRYEIAEQARFGRLVAAVLQLFRFLNSTSSVSTKYDGVVCYQLWWFDYRWQGFACRESPGTCQLLKPRFNLNADYAEARSGKV